MDQLGFEMEATTEEIYHCLNQYATDTQLNLDSPMTLTLRRLQLKLNTQLQRLRMQGVVLLDRNDRDEVESRIAPHYKRALHALFDVG